MSRLAEVFSENIKLLVRHRRRSFASIAEELKMDHDWLRKVTSRGLKRVTAGNEAYLERLRLFFGLASVDELWSPTLSTPPLSPTAIDAVSTGRYSPYAHKLVKLLQTGNHGYLMGLLDTLMPDERHPRADAGKPPLTRFLKAKTAG